MSTELHGQSIMLTSERNVLKAARVYKQMKAKLDKGSEGGLSEYEFSKVDSDYENALEYLLYIIEEEL